MNNQLKYRVFPREENYKTVSLSDGEKDYIKGLNFDMGMGCLL